MADLALNPPGRFDKRPWDPYLTGIVEDTWRRFRWFADLCRDELGIEQYVASGFRTREEQEYLYNGWVRRLPGFNLAAVPGTSKHEKGLAIDCGIGYTRFPRMKDVARRVGFSFTVPSEDWHIEVTSYPDIPAQYTTRTPPSEEDDMAQPFIGRNPENGHIAIFYPGTPFRVYLKTSQDVAQAQGKPPFGMGLVAVGDIDPWFFRNTEPVDAHQ